ncbi:MAG: hypothetical protein GY822_23110 [Deltaproteobacteria bacterium]|nr:hypothetical protein [Deltaproteobacteria bacterium]
MATSLMKRDQKVEKNKRYLFMGVTGAGVAVSALVAPWFGIPMVALGAYLGYDWFKFRAKRGMRF